MDEKNRLRVSLVFASFVLALLPAPRMLAQTLINSSFEEPRETPGTPDFDLVDESLVPGWETTASDDLIEIWSDGFLGVTSFDLDQHAELNATEASTLFQDLDGIPVGGLLSFQFAHRGRSGVDTLRLTITDLGGDGMQGGGDDTVLFTNDYATDNTAWALYTSAGEPPIIALGNTLRFAFEAISSAGGSTGVGNFLDAVEFGVGVLPSPVLQIPTLGPIGIAVLVVLLGLASIALIRRQ